MNDPQSYASIVDQNLSEISGVAEALLFIQEEAEAPQRERLHNSTVTLLHIITDKVRAANTGVTGLHRTLIKLDQEPA